MMTDMYSIDNHDDIGTPITTDGENENEISSRIWTPAQIHLDNFEEELSKCIEIGKSTCHSRSRLQTVRRMQNRRNSDVS